MRLPGADASPGLAQSRRNALLLLAGLVALMWLVEIADVIDGHRLDQYGIEPRDADGLFGIIAAPFLHAGFGHLLGNTVPFALMGALIALRGLGRLLAVMGIVALVSGAGVWLTGSSHSVHIGASGVVFGFAAYLVSRGAFTRSVLEIAVGAVVVLLWGGALLSGFEPRTGVSWQGHLFGAAGGVLAAWLFAPRARPAPSARPAA